MEINLENRDKIIALLKEGTCPICNKKGFKNPLSHMAKKHGFAGRELKDTLLIGHNHGFNAPELAERQKQNAIKHNTKGMLSGGHRHKKSAVAKGKIRLTSKQAFINKPENLERFRQGQRRSYKAANQKALIVIKKSIIRTSDNGEEKSYNSITEAAADNGVSVSAISLCLRGKSHKSAGYKWKYKE